MTKKIIFLRHAETEKDPSINAAFWKLSEKGLAEAKEVSELPIMNEVDSIYVSEEPKTALTAEPLAKRIGKEKEVHHLAFFDEVKRGDKFLKKEEFEAEKTKQLSDLSYRSFDGESGTEALARFKKGIEYVSKESAAKTILVVTHGTILNIYFADLLNAQKELPERWDKTAFCAYGIIQDGKVVKDII